MNKNASTPPHNHLRNSNLELLRIVCMFLVLLIHYIPSRLLPTPETINSNFWEVCLNLELRSLAFVCVNCFILISGYFGIYWKWRSMASLLFQILFYAGIAWIIGYIAMNHGFGNWVDLSGDHIRKAFVVRWFIGAYLMLYLLAPLINRYINNSSNAELGRYILVFYLVSTIYGYILKSDDFNEGMSVSSLIGLYLIGAYLKRQNIHWFKFPAIWDLSIYLILGIGLVVMSIIALKLGITKSVYGYLNPIVILQTIYLFLFFQKLKINQIRWINIAGASAFSVYCLHHHQYIYGLYSHFGKIINQYTSISLLLALGFFASIYLFCMLLDPIRKFLFECIVKGVKVINQNRQQ